MWCVYWAFKLLKCTKSGLTEKYRLVLAYLEKHMNKLVIGPFFRLRYMSHIVLCTNVILDAATILSCQHEECGYFYFFLDVFNQSCLLSTRLRGNDMHS